MLMIQEHLKEFNLVGGTALSLLIGHRMSIDLDFFSLKPFNQDSVIDCLQAVGDFRVNYQGTNTIKGKINGIQVDFITHAYPLVKPLITIDSVRFVSMEDIAAMKLNAIVGNGTRSKDFIDVAALSCHLSLMQMIESYVFKYSNRNVVAVLKSLDYFNDVVKEEPIHLIGERYSWLKIEERIAQMLKNRLQIFSTSPFA